MSNTDSKTGKNQLNKSANEMEDIIKSVMRSTAFRKGDSESGIVLEEFFGECILLVQNEERVFLDIKHIPAFIEFLNTWYKAHQTKSIDNG